MIQEKTEKTEITNKQNQSYDINELKNLISNKKNIDEIKYIKNIQNQIKKISLSLKNQEPLSLDTKKYNKGILFLKNKINVNIRHDNAYAVQRDEIKKDILLNKKMFEKTLQSIIKGKNSYKDKKYFTQLLTIQIDRLKKIDLKKYAKIKKIVKYNKDELSLSIKTNYKELLIQIEAQLLVHEYLINNIHEFRDNNFILDNLSVRYLINSIDEMPVVSYITEVMHYYTNITLGEIIIAILFISLFIFLSKRILPYLKNKIRVKLKEKYGKKGIIFYDYSYDSLSLPLTLFIYVFSAHICVSVFVTKDATPLLNTAYLAIFTLLLYSLLKNLIHFYADNLFEKYPNVRKEMIDFLLRIGKVIIVLFVLLFLFMQLGFDIQAILASLGIGGIAVALAAKDTLTNFFGSLSIITDNSFSQGDWIQAGDIEGTVVDIRMRTTRIRTFANGMITVPNAQLANTPILNWSKRRIGRRIKMSLGITYESKMEDIQLLVDDIRNMLITHDGIATSRNQIDDKDKKPTLLKKEDLNGVKNTLLVYIDEYDASSVNILVYCFSRSPNWEDWLRVKENVIIQISELVSKNNCDFAYPTQSIIVNSDSVEK